MYDYKTIDWTNKDSKISDNFSVGEATYLPSLKDYHIPSEEEKANIVQLADSMEKIRSFLGDNPINVLCWIRPLWTNTNNPKTNGKNYNQLVGGATNSAHINGSGCDYTVSSITCDEVRHLIVPMLETWQLRCENKPGSTWIHTDQRQPLPGGRRFFIP